MNAKENKSFYYAIDTEISIGETINVGDYSYTVDATYGEGLDCGKMYLILETDETVQRKREHSESRNV